MRDLVVLFIRFVATLARLLGPGGARSIVAESLLLKHQLLIVNRSRQRSPNLSVWDRILAGWMALLVPPTRLLRSAIVLKPSTLLGLHKALSKRKYRRLFSPNPRRKSGPKGPSVELIRAVVEMKQRNPKWGCPRIAQQMALAFNLQLDKDVVRRILAHHYRPEQPCGGPSWLTFLGHIKDSLWSMDLFRCESARLRTHQGRPTTKFCCDHCSQFGGSGMNHAQEERHRPYWESGGVYFPVWLCARPTQHRPNWNQQGTG